MGFWPFGGGKRQRAQPTEQENREKPRERQLSDLMTRSEKTSTTDAEGKSSKDERSRRLSKQRLSGAAQQRSFTEPVQIPDKSRKRFSGTNSIHHHSPHVQPNMYNQNTVSQSSIGPENFHAVRSPPTLHARRTDSDANLPRRKSSKRKAEDYAREREIRAMSSSPIPVPKRTATHHNNGGLLQKETRDVPGNLNRRLQRPTSQISLPIPEALPDINQASHQNSFKIGMFAALSPRPTVRYDANPRTLQSKQSSLANQVLRQPIAEEQMYDADKKRIDELADDLDAGGLRELMERDRRRRERKKESDRAKLQRKLQRRADRQREEEAAVRRARTEEYVSRSTSRIADKRNIIDDETIEAGPSKDPFADPETQPKTSTSRIRNPFADEKDPDVLHDVKSLDDEEVEPTVPARSTLRNARSQMSNVSSQPAKPNITPPVSPERRVADHQSMSQGSLLGREVTPDVGETSISERRASDQSSQRGNYWTSFFRRGTGRMKPGSSFQGPNTPSEFSNTSRESFAKKPPPPIVTPRTFRRVDSATPQRTMSKFREDLPELPISPPDSRMQSPEATAAPAGPSGIRQALDKAAATSLGINRDPDAAITPTSPLSIPTGRDKSSLDLDALSNVKAEMPMSQSLASVDSEGSWLSGKPLNRLSGNASTKLRQSYSSLQRRQSHGPTNEPNANGDSSPISAGRPEQEQGDETWHTGLGRQPTLVRQASRAKSKEGLLNEYNAVPARKVDLESDNDSSQDEQEFQEAPIMRARSVEYKGHVRHMSAGSARLLDLRRGSVQSTSSSQKNVANATETTSKL